MFVVFTILLFMRFSSMELVSTEDFVTVTTEDIDDTIYFRKTSSFSLKGVVVSQVEIDVNDKRIFMSVLMDVSEEYSDIPCYLDLDPHIIVWEVVDLSSVGSKSLEYLTLFDVISIERIITYGETKQKVLFSAKSLYNVVLSGLHDFKPHQEGSSYISMCRECVNRLSQYICLEMISFERGSRFGPAPDGVDPIKEGKFGDYFFGLTGRRWKIKSVGVGVTSVIAIGYGLGSYIYDSMKDNYKLNIVHDQIIDEIVKRGTDMAVVGSGVIIGQNLIPLPIMGEVVGACLAKQFSNLILHWKYSDS